MHDVPYFDRFAPVYDLAMPRAKRADLEPGFALADRLASVGLDARVLERGFAFTVAGAKPGEA